jgi:acetyl-CoA carboxylase carboxyl transferase subunit beta
MAWFKRQAKPAQPTAAQDEERRVRTEGLWQKCEGCRQIIWKKDLEATWNVCPKCGSHGRIDAAARIKMLLDGDFEQYDTDLRSSDPLGFVDSKPYKDRLSAMEQATGLTEALISAAGAIDGRKVQICAMEPRFIGGSMGCVVGEKITRAVERAILSSAR